MKTYSDNQLIVLKAALDTTKKFELQQLLLITYGWFRACTAMGKYTEDAAQLIPKSEVALTQLDDAIELFIAGRYLSAITLAGAADAIFCGLIEANDGQVPAEVTWEQIEAARQMGIPLAGDISRKEAFQKWNSTRNRLKHHDAGRDTETLEIFEIDEAYEWIERARHSAKELQLRPRNEVEFDNHVIPWFFLNEN